MVGNIQPIVGESRTTSDSGAYRVGCTIAEDRSTAQLDNLILHLKHCAADLQSTPEAHGKGQESEFYV